MSFVPLSMVDVALAAMLILLNGLVSWAFRLGLERSIAIAALRMIVQLALIGLVLKLIFEATSPLWTVVAGCLMVVAAAYEISSRQERRIGGWAMHGLGAGTLMLVGTLATVFAVAGIVRPEPWYEPRYVLPVLGMILGNMLTGIGLVFATMTEAAHRDRARIEARLAHGAGRLEALSGVLQHGLKTGLMPILNAMAASGIVWLPGMMTGQIMAGVDPIEASKYQIMILSVIAGATSLAVLIAGVGCIYLMTDSRYRLRLDQLSGNRDGKPTAA